MDWTVSVSRQDLLTNESRLPVPFHAQHRTVGGNVVGEATVVIVGAHAAITEPDVAGIVDFVANEAHGLPCEVRSASACVRHHPQEPRPAEVCLTAHAGNGIGPKIIARATERASLRAVEAEVEVDPVHSDTAVEI